MSQHPSDDPERPFFATAAKGTEGVLRDELQRLRVPKVKATRGGVHFGREGEGIRSALRVCLHSRVALRVLERQASFAAPDERALYDGVSAVHWERVLDARRTLAVDATIKDAPVTSSAYAAQRVKDAIVDRLRDLHGARPDVDKRDPDVGVVLHWVGDHASVLLDVSGESLHARGYRSEGGEAPLRETLAAAIVQLAGWDERVPLLDPMCGSGTLAIEAAQQALAIAPGLLRARYGCERWASHDEGERALAAELRAAARAAARPPAGAPPIFARDTDERALERARRNAERAGVAAAISFALADVRQLTREHERAVVVTNPPYGERLAAGPDFERELAAALHRLHGYRVNVLAQSRAILRAMRDPPQLEHALWNGALQCRLLAWEIAQRA